jgi:hypothetical protein
MVLAITAFGLVVNIPVNVKCLDKQLNCLLDLTKSPNEVHGEHYWFV